MLVVVRRNVADLRPKSQVLGHHCYDALYKIGVAENTVAMRSGERGQEKYKTKVRRWRKEEVVLNLFRNHQLNNIT